MSPNVMGQSRERISDIRKDIRPDNRSDKIIIYSDQFSGLILHSPSALLGPPKAQLGPNWAWLRPCWVWLRPGRRDVWTDGYTNVRTYGWTEILPCVLQDIDPAGPLPKNKVSLLS